MIAQRIPRIPARIPSRLDRQAVIVVPLILVNTLAAVGQVLWAQEHLTVGLAAGVARILPYLFAGAVESIALYLSYEAHQSRINGDSAGFLALASYVWAGVAAFLNWSHWHSTSGTAALVYAAMSALSPWLWSIRSRSIHRVHLRKTGQIEPRAVKFGRARWLLYPRRTFRVLRKAVWAAVVDPLAAIRAYDEASEAVASGKNVTARAPLAAVTDAGSGSSPAPDPADSSGSFFEGWTEARDTILPAPAMSPSTDVHLGAPRLKAVSARPDMAGDVIPDDYREDMTPGELDAWMTGQRAKGVTVAVIANVTGLSTRTVSRRAPAPDRTEDSAESDSEREAVRA